ncbi:hypothetical protein [Nocardia crassostreae]|uniref:hypothetical protein n=1 Tax=Nocardia crassostreae TaxID=53428 RepID=UPI00082D5F10|nr:hypothetical protein [Nocardia crassostreae]
MPGLLVSACTNPAWYASLTFTGICTISGAFVAAAAAWAVARRSTSTADANRAEERRRHDVDQQWKIFEFIQKDERAPLRTRAGWLHSLSDRAAELDAVDLSSKIGEYADFLLIQAHIPPTEGNQEGA